MAAKLPQVMTDNREMTTWDAARLMILRRGSLSRILSEKEFSRLMCGDLSDLTVSNILVAGSGKQHTGSERIFYKPFVPQANIVFVDINPKRKPDVRADLTDPWPFQSEEFDLVVTTWVVEHVNDPAKFFRESCRVLQDNGTLICAVPFIFHKHGCPADYWRFTDSALAHLAREAGYRKAVAYPIEGAPFICCVHLLWPVFKVPLTGYLAFLGARLMDGLLRFLAGATNKGHDFLDSYPLHHIVVATK
ncbi:MAG: class I SAM-dependent methyltransferase [Armatimonadetes bacterium]|nr:class I SAM-dependent methyltransferase [Armatimonadota bacterium]